MKVKIIYENREEKIKEFFSDVIEEIEIDLKTHSIYFKQHYKELDDSYIDRADFIRFNELINVKITK